MNAVLILASLVVGQPSLGEVVGVGCVPPPGRYAVRLVDRFEGFKAPCIVVRVGSRQARLAPTAPRALIETELLRQPTYEEAVARALAQGEALVVGLRCDVPAPEPNTSLNWYAIRVESLEGFDKPGLLLSVPNKKEGVMQWIETLLPGTSAAQVRGAYHRWMDQQQQVENRARDREGLPRMRLEKWHPYRQPSAQERIDAQKRIRRQTSNLRLIAPRQRSVSGNC